jgi:hypothetical protein
MKILTSSAVRDVLEEKMKPVSTSEKGSAEMSKSDIRMDDVKRAIASELQSRTPKPGGSVSDKSFDQ